MLERIGAQADNERKAWEDKLLQRQHGLEAQSQEARRDWHRLSAQVDTLSTYVSERTLRTEHEELAASVAAPRRKQRARRSWAPSRASPRQRREVSHLLCWRPRSSH